MSLDKAMKNLKYDRRLLEWNLANNQITQEEYNKLLQDLPDLKDKVDLERMVDTKDDSDSH